MIEELINDILKKIKEGRYIQSLFLEEANIFARMKTIFVCVEENPILMQDELINTFLTQANLSGLAMDTIVKIEERINQLKKKKMSCISFKKENIPFPVERECEVQQHYLEILKIQESLENILKNLETCLRKLKNSKTDIEINMEDIFHDVVHLIGHIDETWIKIYLEMAKQTHIEYEKLEEQLTDEEEAKVSLFPLRMNKKREYPSHKKGPVLSTSNVTQEQVQYIRSLLKDGQNSLALTLMGDLKNEVLIRILYEIELEKILLEKEVYTSLEEQQILQELLRELLEEKQNIQKVGKEEKQWQKLK